VCIARDQTGAWARSATADAACPLPPAAASQARCAGAPRLRPDPRAGAPPVPLLCRPRSFSAASSCGLEGVDPRDHRSGNASARRFTTELPLCLCAVPRNPQPVARPIAARGCPVRRASSPQLDVPKCLEPFSALLRTGAGLDPTSASGCPAADAFTASVPFDRCTPEGVSWSHSAPPPTLPTRPLTRPKPARFVSGRRSTSGRYSTDESVV